MANRNSRRRRPTLEAMEGRLVLSSMIGSGLPSVHHDVDPPNHHHDVDPSDHHHDVDPPDHHHDVDPGGKH